MKAKAWRAAKLVIGDTVVFHVLFCLVFESFTPNRRELSAEHQYPPTSGSERDESGVDHGGTASNPRGFKNYFSTK